MRNDHIPRPTAGSYDEYVEWIRDMYWLGIRHFPGWSPIRAPYVPSSSPVPPSLTPRHGRCPACNVTIDDYHGHRLFCPLKIDCALCGGSPAHRCVCRVKKWADAPIALGYIAVGVGGGREASRPGDDAREFPEQGDLTPRWGPCPGCNAWIDEWQGHRLMCTFKIVCPCCGGSPSQYCACEEPMWRVGAPTAITDDREEIAADDDPSGRSAGAGASESNLASGAGVDCNQRTPAPRLIDVPPALRRGLPVVSGLVRDWVIGEHLGERERIENALHALRSIGVIVPVWRPRPR
jgi:hypothetical protein